MRHRFAHRKLGRTSHHRLSMLRNLASSLIEKGRVVTTLEKAKELRPYVEKLITKAREDNFHSRTLVSARVFTSASIDRLFSSVAPGFASRPGGYTRIVRLGFRPGDNARIALVEFVDDSFIAESPKLG